MYSNFKQTLSTLVRNAAKKAQKLELKRLTRYGKYFNIANIYSMHNNASVNSKWWVNSFSIAKQKSWRCANLFLEMKILWRWNSNLSVYFEIFLPKSFINYPELISSRRFIISLILLRFGDSFNLLKWLTF